MSQPGEYPNLVVVQRAVTSTDDYGGETKTWHTHHTDWAKFLPGPSEERRQAAQENAEIAATFEFIWNPTIAATRTTDRLYYLDTVWDIHGVVVLGANQRVQITGKANPDEEIDS
jgi:head-tail adaptor